MSTGVDLVSAEPLLPMKPEQARAAMAQFQALTDAMLEPSDWQSADSNGRKLKKPFVKRSGWRKIATGYRLSCEIASEEIERDPESGEAIRAHVRVRVFHHESGRAWEGSGGCSINEPSFNTPNKRAKAEHDIPGTAFTRAANRATADLVGFGQVSAEEVDGTGSEPDTIPTLDLAGQEEVSKALEASWPMYDAVKFISTLERRYPEGIPEPAGVALRAWAWFCEQPGNRIDHEPENAPPEPAESAYHNPRPEDVYPPGRYQGD